MSDDMKAGEKVCEAVSLARCVTLALACFSLSAVAAVDLSKLPPPSTNRVEFDRDIKPIFEKACFKCHGPEKPKSGLRLDTRAAALKGGDNGEAIKPGNSAASRLIYFVGHLVPDMEMPPKGKGEPLTREEVATLRAWIDQGANWGASAPVTNTEFAISPATFFTTVSGNERKFREHYWFKEGWNGGAEHFELKQQIDERSKIFIEGHALRDDYRVALTVERNELGFARFGFEQYRKYYSDTGGYYPLFRPSAFSLERDLHLDIGRVWADFGLTLPQWPRMVLGYEYQYREGAKSTLLWGDVFPGNAPQGADSRKIFPSAKQIDERVHILKFDLDHEVRGVRIEDNFRAEFYDESTSRADRRRDLLPPNPTVLAFEKVNEGYRSFVGANAIRLEKQFNDWLFASGGYLYSKLSADAAFSLDTLNPADVVLGKHFTSQQILLERESHVFNLNALLGPWDGFTVSAGVQEEWTRQRGLGDVSLDNFDFGSGTPFLNPVNIHADLDREILMEQFGLRYTRVPFTVLFAEARFQQEDIGQFEQQVGGDAEFVRNTEASSELKDFRIGFNTSPWQRVSFGTHYRRYEKESRYNHPVDDSLFSGSDGYSAFIRSRDTFSDEVEAKLVLRPASWLKTIFSYKLLDTDFRTGTDAATDVNPGDASPGGSVLAGRQTAHILSFNSIFTKIPRLYLSTTFSYQNSRTATEQNQATAIVPYRGDIYSALASATFAVNPKVDLIATYLYSRADFSQSNFVEGLPLGIQYDRHAVQAGITRRFGKSVVTKLQYGFFCYDEPSSGNINNYTAHSVFATLALRLP